jgi:FKBP-type peptidyl-prolyl cis-trans isomerase FkpA
MKIRTTIFLSIAVISLLWSCNNDVKTTPKGYVFKIVKAGDGKIVQPGEIIIIDMAIVDQNDSAWYDNRKTDYPEMVQIADASKMEAERGISEIFRMLSKGDSVEFTLRAKDMFLFMWKMDPPPGVDPQSDFTYRIKAREIFSYEEGAKFIIARDSIHAIHVGERRRKEAEEQLKADSELAAYNKIQIGKDTVLIDNFLKSKNMKFSKLPSGLRFILKTKGEGPRAVKGDLVNMKYTGTFLDGKEFDAGEYNFRVGNREVIDGWDLIATDMQKGTSMTLFVPSTLAYGKGGGRMAPDAILVFEMELLSINNK